MRIECDANRFSLGAVLLIGVTVLLCGCGSKSGKFEVSGNVSYEGQPVEIGEIIFLSSEGHQVSAPIVDGAYVLPTGRGVKPGAYAVKISGERKSGKTRIATEMDMKYEIGQKVDLYESFIPAEYNTKTILKTEFDRGKKQYDFALPIGENS